MNDRTLLVVVIVTLIVASASLTQTFLLTAAVTDQNNHIDQLASQLGGLAGVVSSLMTSTSTQSSPTTQSNNVVYLEVVPDFGGATYDAFVVPGSLGGSTPNASSTAGAAPNNNITVSHGVPIKFVIINIDTALNENFTGQVSVPFTLYNDSASGEVALQYAQGETISKLPISHTFSIADLQVNIPLPADTMVVFTYTFSTPGVYAYICTAPCGPGMGLAGYMLGYLIVT